jgi:hypothetical protein
MALELLPSSALPSTQVFTTYPNIVVLENRTFHLLIKPDILTCYEQQHLAISLFSNVITQHINHGRDDTVEMIFIEHQRRTDKQVGTGKADQNAAAE